MGKSLLKKLNFSGGQNPIEAAKSGCKVYYGPYIHNFNEVYEFLEKNKIAKKINGREELVDNLMEDFKQTKEIDHVNIEELNKYGESILNNTIKELDKFI